MKSIKEMGMRLLAKQVVANARKEADSACIFLGYQPKMPDQVKQMNRRNG